MLTNSAMYRSLQMQSLDLHIESCGTQLALEIQLELRPGRKIILIKSDFFVCLDKK